MPPSSLRNQRATTTTQNAKSCQGLFVAPSRTNALPFFLSGIADVRSFLHGFRGSLPCKGSCRFHPAEQCTQGTRRSSHARNMRRHVGGGTAQTTGFRVGKCGSFLLALFSTFKTELCGFQVRALASFAMLGDESERKHRGGLKACIISPRVRSKNAVDTHSNHCFQISLAIRLGSVSHLSVFRGPLLTSLCTVIKSDGRFYRRTPTEARKYASLVLACERIANRSITDSTTVFPPRSPAWYHPSLSPATTQCRGHGAFFLFEITNRRFSNLFSCQQSFTKLDTTFKNDLERSEATFVRHPPNVAPHRMIPVEDTLSDLVSALTWILLL